MKKTIRSGSGVGDNIYLHSVVRHLAKQNPQIHYSVRTRFPELFCQLPKNVSTEEFSKVRCDIVSHYSTRKRIKDTDQYQDMLITAGLPKESEFATDWQVMNKGFTDGVLKASGGKPIVIVNQPRAPMGRRDGFGLEILPDSDVFDYTALQVKELLGAYLVQIGGKEADAMHECPHIDLSLVGKTSLKGIMDLGRIASAGFGQCSQIIPLMEIFDKPVMIAWGHRVAQSKEEYVRTILPEKILHGKKSSWVFGNWSNEKIYERVEEWVKQSF